MMNLLSSLKIAIVYDRINKFGGAERVVLALHEMFPKAPLYTSVYNPKKAPWAKVFPKVYTSFLQYIPILNNYHELLGWLTPIAFSYFNFDNYDVVISVTGEGAKSVKTSKNTFHFCYMLTPTRYLWSGYYFYLNNPPTLFRIFPFYKLISKPFLWFARKLDLIGSKRPDKIIAISTEVQKRINKYYKRESEIIFPPVLAHYATDMHYKKSLLRVSPKAKTSRKFFENAYLIVSRLEKYKKVDLAIQVFNKLNLPLVIVGVGNEEKYLKSIARKNIKFVGYVNDNKLADYYSRAKAFIMPLDEDFGITALEAQSFGVPIIAYRKGGVMDTVIDGKTGILFDKQNEKSLVQAVKKFDMMSFSKVELRKNAKNFSEKRFKRQLQKSLVRSYISWRRRNPLVAKISK
jgi:glycosyltransferase involved in cell wall biosynthesis